MSKFIIRAAAGGVKFDLHASNGQVIATSEIYTSAAVCRKGIESVRKCAPCAKLEDQTEPDYRIQTNPKFELYMDKADEYRFRLKARNGKIIAVSEGYTTRTGCENGIDSVRINAADAEISEE